jgi:heme-degrading monooxygenase HmoA
MNCTRIALYDITSGTFDEVVSQAKTGMAPLFQHSPGFVSYGVAKIDKAAFVSLSTWETREQADTATTNAAGWVKANSQDRFALRENYIGDLAIDIEAAKTADLAR